MMPHVGGQWQADGPPQWCPMF